ncbi:MAG TPA: hypothetical protein VF647_23410 [Longimicrobium sp.]|jgi:hypothetical protein
MDPHDRSEPIDADWSAIAGEARARTRAALPTLRRTGMVIGGAALVTLPFAPPVGVALGLLAGLFYGVVIRPTTAGDPMVFVGRIAGRRMWRKVWDANEGPDDAENRVPVAHFAKWMVDARIDTRVILGPDAQRVQAEPVRQMDFAVARELFLSLGDGAAVGFIVTPSNDLLGYVTSAGQPVWFAEPTDQAWKRGGYKVLDDPEVWPE